MNTSDTRHTADVGAWFIGARGSLATTATLGIHALAAGVATPVGLTTETDAVRVDEFPAIADIVVGGHDISTTPLEERARQLAAGGMFPAALVDAVAERLRETDRNLLSLIHI